MILSIFKILKNSQKIFKTLTPPFRSFSLYNEIYKKSLEERELFWGEAAREIKWSRESTAILDKSNPIFPKWFEDGKLNMAYNCVDRHVLDGFGDQLAVIYDSPITGLVQKMTYKELLTSIQLLAGVMVNHGVQKGDRVLIYLPMIPQTLITMLACARIGAIHSLVFGGFAALELAVRIQHAEPKLIVSANVGVEPNRLIDYKRYMDEAISISTFKPKACLIFNRPGHKKAKLEPNRDFDWDSEFHSAKPHDIVEVESNHPLYILYTSGTTGLPKGVVRPTAGYAVSLKWSMKHLYGINPGDIWWAASDFGWVVGHSYICYGPLLHRCTTIIYEGKPVGTPDTSQFFRVLNWHNPVALFVAPTALRAIRRDDPHATHGAKYSHPYLRSLFVAGEHCDVETLHWAQEIFKVSILDHWWQTETGWPITCPAIGIESKESLIPPPGSAGRPVPGFDVKIFDNKTKKPLGHNKLGRIVIKLPLPPGMCSTLYKNDENYEKIYFSNFPGYYDTMDAGISLKSGHIMVMARDDDVINVAGHRISSGALEEACLENKDIVECAVIGLNDKIKGQIPLGLIVPDNETTKTDKELIMKTIEVVRNRIGAVANFRNCVVVHKLPKTRSGKISRNSLSAMANGKPFKAPVTLEDPTVFDPIYNAFLSIGLKPSEPKD